MIKFVHKGNFKNTEKFLNISSKTNYITILEKYGREGVAALSSATPIDSSLTANSWDYDISSLNGKYTITWTNSNIVNGIPVVILIQYGHGTKNGGYVKGKDFINPAIKPIFDKIANDAWMEVRNI